MNRPGIGAITLAAAIQSHNAASTMPRVIELKRKNRCALAAAILFAVSRFATWSQGGRDVGSAGTQ
jgi:hypothetical protein